MFAILSGAFTKLDPFGKPPTSIWIKLDPFGEPPTSIWIKLDPFGEPPTSIWIKLDPFGEPPTSKTFRVLKILGKACSLPRYAIHLTLLIRDKNSSRYSFL